MDSGNLKTHWQFLCETRHYYLYTAEKCYKYELRNRPPNLTDFITYCRQQPQDLADCLNMRVSLYNKTKTGQIRHVKTFEPQKLDKFTEIQF